MQAAAVAALTAAALAAAPAAQAAQEAMMTAEVCIALVIVEDYFSFVPGTKDILMGNLDHWEEK